jgi:hypothetical protein
MALVTVGIAAFLGGVIVAQQWAIEPQLITDYGRHVSAIAGTATCHGNVRTERLRNKADDFDVALACGPFDGTVDELRDTRAVLSGAREIRTNEDRVAFQMPLTNEQFRQVGMHPSWWYRVVLIPKGTPTIPKTIREAQELRGMVVGERMTETIY